MKIVYSLWSVPQGMTVDHRIILGLSYTLARRHYSRLEMVTDRAGAALCERMGLKFESVRLDLEGFDVSPAAWAAGKMLAYALQTEPFAHIDHDVFLFRPLPERITSARVFAQNDEAFWRYKDCLSRTHPPHVPVMTLPPPRWHAYNTGLFGGSDLGFIRDYAAKGLQFVRDHPEFHYWAMPAYEQAWLSRYADDLGVPVELLLKHEEGDPAAEEEATALGYCHLMQCKYRGTCMTRVRERIRKEDPDLFHRAILAGPTTGR